MSLEEAALYRRRFFESYPGLKRWHEQERRAWLRGGTETRTLIGRHRTDVQKLTDRLNAPVQGTATDGVKLALALLWERRNECPGAVPVLVCHDEVVVECDADKAEEAKEWLVQAMKDGMDAAVNVVEPHILIEVEASVSKAWSG
jgi:DNA polymerase-1